MFSRAVRFLPIGLVFLAVFSRIALAENSLVTQLQSVLDDFHAANPSAPGVVVRVVSPSRGLDPAPSHFNAVRIGNS